MSDYKSVNGQSDDEYIRDTLPLFIQEWTEQLDSLEQTLLALESDAGNKDLLDALFRCVHTIKGSAGFFGLTTMVSFTHHIETALDLLRDGKLKLDASLSSTLLKCGDEIRHLVESSSSSNQDAPEYGKKRDALVAVLLALMGVKPQGHYLQVLPAPASAEQTGAADQRHLQTTALNANLSISGSATDADMISAGFKIFDIAVRFHSDTYRNGMDPLSIIRYLKSLAIDIHVKPNLTAIPLLGDFQPESCYWDLTVELRREGTMDAVESAFSFVREDCDLAIVERLAAEKRGLRQDDNPHGSKVDVAGLISSTKASDTQVNESSSDTVSVADKPALGLAETKSDETKAADIKLPASPVRAKTGEDNKFIRVQADRLDRVINLLGELVVASAGAEMLAKEIQRSDLLESSAHVAKLIQEIRGDALQLRMVPIADTFNRFKRVVRDTASELHKDIAFDTAGGETELDKAMVEMITDPLMHIVRNAIDHGLETPEERRRVGKSEQGHLHLSAEHEAGSVLIRITDDGKGIQRGKVLQRAWERGLVEPGVTPPDADIVKLIFAPGFSTADKVTNLSGRGVGMDVVRSNIEALHGHVQVFSEEGQGTTIQIRLPLTLAIIDGFLISVGNKKFIFPLDAVFEVIEGGVSELNNSKGTALIELRGHVLPVINLREIYDLGGDKPKRHSVVVVQSGAERYGVCVDSLLGQHQTVIKPMSRLFHALQFISGSTILGNGEIAFIFDPHALCELATKAAKQYQAKPVATALQRSQ
jgi:two-component system chemotaxis sensor kinase CheA